MTIERMRSKPPGCLSSCFGREAALLNVTPLCVEGGSRCGKPPPSVGLQRLAGSLHGPGEVPVVLHIGPGDVSGRLAVRDQTIGEDHAARVDVGQLLEVPGEGEDFHLAAPDREAIDLEVGAEHRRMVFIGLLDQLPQRLGALRPVPRVQQLLGPRLAPAGVGRELTGEQAVITGAFAEEIGEPAHGGDASAPPTAAYLCNGNSRFGRKVKR